MTDELLQMYSKVLVSNSFVRPASERQFLFFLFLFVHPDSRDERRLWAAWQKTGVSTSMGCVEMREYKSARPGRLKVQDVRLAGSFLSCCLLLVLGAFDYGYRDAD